MICRRLQNTGNLPVIFSIQKSLRKLLSIPIPLEVSPALVSADVGLIGILLSTIVRNITRRNG